LVFLILINAFFAASEMALISVNDARIHAAAEDGDKKALQIKKILQQPSKFLATIQIGVTLAGFLASAVASQAFVNNLSELFDISWFSAFAKPAAVAVITLILSYFSLVFGELVPKRLAMNSPDKFAAFSVSAITLLSKISSPVVWLLSSSTNIVVRLFGLDPNEDKSHVTEEEIRMLVDVGEEKGDIGKIEKELINNIFDFHDQDLVEIMTHRTKVIGFPITATLDSIIEVITLEKFSRFPVYNESLDDIIGILHVKDLLPRLASGLSEENFDLREFIRTPLFVPISRPPQELLKDMNKTKSHMAVVIDEYGGTAGIVTLEDLLEEIVGNIFDEYDEEEKVYELVDENKYIFNTNIEFNTFCEIIGYPITEELEDEYDTMSGFIIGYLGRIPVEGEHVEFESNGFLFKVLKVEDKQVTGLSVEKLFSEENQAEVIKEIADE